MQALSVHLYALFQAILSSIALMLQCATLPLFLVFADYRARISHQMMLRIGLFDVFQLLSVFIYAICLIAQVEVPNWAEKLIAGLYLYCWDALVMQHFVLALNRALTIIRSYHRPMHSTPKWEAHLFAALNALIWVYLVGMAVLCQTPLVGAKFDGGAIIFDLSLPYSAAYLSFQYHMTLTLAGISFCCYCAIMVALRKSRNRVRQLGQNAPPPLLSPQERRVLLQAGILFSGMLATMVALITIMAATNNVLAIQVFEFVFIFYCGVNPALYLTMNPEFRWRFLQMYCAQKNNNNIAEPPNKPIMVKPVQLA